MCRWLAYISKEEDCLLEDLLIAPKHSLVKQVDEHYLPLLTHYAPDDPLEKANAKRDIMLNLDGLGLVWYTSTQADFNPGHVQGQRPAMYKTVSPALNDFNLQNLCANTHARVVLGHIRASSSTPIALTNNHPFIFGRHSFMHNGTITDFTAIRRDICTLLDRDTFAAVLGSTDSEHLAALYMSILSNGEGEKAWEKEYSSRQMAFAMHMAVVCVLETQQKILGRAFRPSSLNLCATDGKRLIAYRFRNHKREQPPSLYYSTTAGVTMNRRYPDHPDGPDAPKEVVASRSANLLSENQHSAHIIVASEPSTYKEEEWTLIGKNQCLLYEEDGSYEVKAIEYKDAWNARDDNVDK